VSDVKARLRLLEGKAEKLPKPDPDGRRWCDMSEAEQWAELCALFRCDALRMVGPGQVTPGSYRPDEYADLAADVSEWAAQFEGPLILLTPDELRVVAAELLAGRLFMSWSVNGRGDVTDHLVIQRFGCGTGTPEGEHLMTALNCALQAWAAQTGQPKPDTLDGVRTWLHEVTVPV
jgi:hypothetical protein